MSLLALRPRTLLAALVLGVAVMPSSAPAQSTPPSSAPACLGFAFGRWSPALDWRAAGHGAVLDTSRVQHAPSGRDWAVGGTATESDSVLILFPRWWPVGVAVELPTREPAPGDTIVGRARAFVASGQSTVPTTRVRAWRVPCAGAH
jgi:hypothetical protein